ncbi:hypothetical protein B5C00_08475 [Staphylococcus delphini]|uniref:Bacterial toxin 50 domain-containing protein n=1 Tax=Staphylococcus delphini TaxID=53344 RepID=A0ABX9NIR0_9STAP|nr:polymorphic toxin type 50 domain-containing protein [Staphylococcus delphini]NBK47970.1 hypothetical protein [Staphylococcus delphini]PCF33361.1 hypothetical protein B5C00_08475 [Staphylococcus delphini]PNZ91917.1 hypothetical protein CD148_09760 [Staphylococcus delphini]RIZ54842.1 hypothetical protein CDL68_04545 [Staphylococcus delphini]
MGRALIDGEFIETKWGTVHDSKTGTHIVPYEKEDK